MKWSLTAAALAALAGIFASPVAYSAGADLEFYTGADLYAQCSPQPADPDFAARRARCAGYVMGVSDALQAQQGAGRANAVCITAVAGAPTLVEAVRQFLDAHPEKRQLAAQDLVVEALSAAFPCP